MVAFVALCAAPAKGEWRYGLRLGGDFTLPTAEKQDAVPAPKGGSGFTGGITFEWQMPTSGLAIGLSATYQRRNITAYSLSSTGDSPATSYRLGKDFLAFPLDFKYKFWLPATHNTVAPYILTGPDLAVALQDYGRRMHFGWNVGAGLDIINFLEISGGYRFGINSVNPGMPDVHDSGAFVAVALLFDF